MNEIEIPGKIDCGDAEPKTFEDMYYETLIALYELKPDEKNVLDNKGN